MHGYTNSACLSAYILCIRMHFNFCFIMYPACIAVFFSVHGIVCVNVHVCASVRCAFLRARVCTGHTPG